MEYAHRFRTAYDVVWWINADPADVHRQRAGRPRPALDIPLQATVPESARAVLQSAAARRADRRWLLIFDNAEDPDAARPVSADRRSGHVLITSRNPAWGDRAQPIADRRVRAARRASPTSGSGCRRSADEDADRVAELLGDLPIAVAAAGAWLADTGTSVADVPRLASSRPDPRRPGPAAVRRRSRRPGTCRCSGCRSGPRPPTGCCSCARCSPRRSRSTSSTATSSAGARARSTRACPSDWSRGALVQQINRLALLGSTSAVSRARPAAAARQIQVHRLLQHVVRSRMTPEELRRGPPPGARRCSPRPGRRARSTTPRPGRGYRHALAAPGGLGRGPQLHDEAVRAAAHRPGPLPVDPAATPTPGRTWPSSSAATWTSSWTRPRRTRPSGRRCERQLLHLRFNLANVLRDQGSFEESLSASTRRCCAQQAELLGARHPHTLMTAGGLAADLRGLGRYAEALDRDERDLRGLAGGLRRGPPADAGRAEQPGRLLPADGRLPPRPASATSWPTSAGGWCSATATRTPC